MKNLLSLGLMLSLLSVSSMSFAMSPPTIYQAGTIINLANGLYQGTTTFASLYQKGNFGLGTDNGPEGEMVILDKQAYAADINGNAHALKPSDETPFTMIVQFQPDKKFTFQQVNSLSELTDQLDKQLPSQNIFYAIKVTGKFSYLRMRDWEKPTSPVPADQWIQKNQHVSEFNGIDGTLVIFKAPKYAGSITVGGYHVHFISSDHKKVGHVYDIKLPVANVELETIYQFNLQLPQTNSFLQANLKDISNDTVAKLEVGKS